MTQILKILKLDLVYIQAIIKYPIFCNLIQYGAVLLENKSLFV